MTYIKSPRRVFITHAQPSHKSSCLMPWTPRGTSRWVKCADPDVWHFSLHGSGTREEPRSEWRMLGSVGLWTEPTRQRMSSEVLGSLSWRHVRACVTPSRGARVARRHWRGRWALLSPLWMTSSHTNGDAHETSGAGASTQHVRAAGGGLSGQMEG